jgi:neutral trehalase
MYGWDSYFIGAGLLIDNHLETIAIADNFKYQIIHYGKILNVKLLFNENTTAIVFFFIS